jgi:hypothetical protein
MLMFPVLAFAEPDPPCPHVAKPLK